MGKRLLILIIEITLFCSILKYFNILTEITASLSIISCLILTLIEYLDTISNRLEKINDALVGMCLGFDIEDKIQKILDKKRKTRNESYDEM